MDSLIQEDKILEINFIVLLKPHDIYLSGLLLKLIRRVTQTTLYIFMRHVTQTTRYIFMRHVTQTTR